MTKIIISIGATIVALGGLVWIAQPNASGPAAPQIQASNGSLTVLEASRYDFGNISMAAGKVKYVFKIKNTGTEAVTINKMFTSCMCTSALLTVGERKIGPYGMPGHGFVPTINQVVQPAVEITVEAVFDPAAHGPAGVGQINRVITLENNAGAPVELQIAAFVTP